MGEGRLGFGRNDGGKIRGCNSLPIDLAIARLVFGSLLTSPTYSSVGLDEGRTSIVKSFLLLDASELTQRHSCVSLPSFDTLQPVFVHTLSAHHIFFMPLLINRHPFQIFPDLNLTIQPL